MFLEEFSDTVHKTMIARFTAFRRMKRNRDASKAAESFFSSSIIAISLIALLKSDIELSNRISILTIILSTFLLVMSLLFSGLNYDKRMGNYHECGNELIQLYRQIQYGLSFKETLHNDDIKLQSEEFLNKYFDILLKYNLNHTSFDYEYASAMMDEKEQPIMVLLFLKFRYYVWDMYFLYWLIAIVPICIIAFYLVETIGRL